MFQSLLNLGTLFVSAKYKLSCTVHKVPTTLSISCAHALDSTYFESLFAFGFVHLNLDPFLRFSFVCLLSFIACFLLVFVGFPLSLSLNPSLDIVLVSNLNFYCFLLFTLKSGWLLICSWFIWFELTVFGSLVDDTFSAKCSCGEEKQFEWPPREKKGVSWDLQGGVHTLEGDIFWRLAERET